MALEGTVETPLGRVKKSTAAIVGGGIVLLLGIAWWRHKQAAGPGSSSASSPAAIPAATAGDPYPPDGTVGNPADLNSTDPATGMTYGDEQLYGGGFGGGFGGGPGGPGPGGGGGGGGGFTTNAQWAQWVEQAMGSTGSDAIAAALGRYLAGLPVTTDQQTIILQAIAIGGQPPVGGANGFPPAIDLQPGGGNVAVPNVVGQEVDAAQRALAAAGLKWSRGSLKKGVGYHVTAESPVAGTQVAAGSTVALQIAPNTK